MDMHAFEARPAGADDYLFGPRQAWFAFGDDHRR